MSLNSKMIPKHNVHVLSQVANEPRGRNHKWKEQFQLLMKLRKLYNGFQMSCSFLPSDFTKGRPLTEKHIVSHTLENITNAIN